jgi:V/A-type H+-transporting ATPase subunit F
MRFFLISDNIDTAMGMRLAGVESVVLHEAEPVRRALEEAAGNSDIGIILITDKLAPFCREQLDALRLSGKARPLALVIPDRHGPGQESFGLDDYLARALGLGQTDPHSDISR